MHTDARVRAVDGQHMGGAGHCTRLLPPSAVLEGWRATLPLRASTAALAARGVRELGRVGANLLVRQVGAWTGGGGWGRRHTPR